MSVYSYDLRFAGIRIRILAPRPLLFPDNFQPFLQSVNAGQKPDWIVEVIFGTDHLPNAVSGSVKRFPCQDGESYYRILPADRANTCQLFVPAGMADPFCVNANWTLFLMPECLLLPHGRILLHASAVKYEGQAILFAAPSGIGKSTQASLWETYRGAEIMNGDKVIVRANAEPPVAFGGPIAGTSRIYKDIQAPIQAIVYLHQGEENQLAYMDERHAFMALYSQAVKSPDDMAFNQALIPLLADIAKKTPVVDFSCKPDETAVTYLQSRLNRIPAK